MNDLTFIDYDVHAYALIPTHPLIVGTARLEQRHGAIVEVKVNSNNKIFSVFSDLAPLQGFSSDGLKSGIAALERTLPRWLDHELPLIDLTQGLSDLWEAFVDVEPDLNALSWCMYGICVLTHSKIRSLPPHVVLSGKESSKKNVEVALEKRGNGAPKIKFHSEDDLFRILDETSHRKIRLDSNAVFSGEQALRLAKKLPVDRIVYWEEPTFDPNAFQRLRTLGFRLAKDESLLASDWKKYPCDAYVIKPTVLGWRKTHDVIVEAQMRDLPIGISTAYESKIGREFLRELACSLGPETTIGLGGERLFVNDITTTSFRS